MSDHLGPHDRLSKEALDGLDGKVVPVTIGDEEGKRVIGVGTLKVVEGELQMFGKITDPRVAEVMFAEELPYFSIPKEDDVGA